MFRPIILILRPQQWVKNLFIFLPLFFDGKLLEVSYLLPAFATFLAYCFAANGIYCLNDILDTEADRKHPLKCKRPIARVPLGNRKAIYLCFVALEHHFLS